MTVILDMRSRKTWDYRAHHGWNCHLAFDDLRVVFWRMFKVGSTSTQGTFDVVGMPPHRAVGPEEVAGLLADGYVGVGLKRHPLSRLVSAHHNPGFGPPRGEPYAFPELVRAVCKVPDAYVDKHVRSQTWKMPGGLSLFPIEDMPSSWERVQNVFRAREVELPPLPKANSRSYPSWESFYDEETRRLAELRYLDDLVLLGYSS